MVIILPIVAGNTVTTVINYKKKTTLDQNLFTSWPYRSKRDVNYLANKLAELQGNVIGFSKQSTIITLHNEKNIDEAAKSICYTKGFLMAHSVPSQHAVTGL